MIRPNVLAAISLLAALLSSASSIARADDRAGALRLGVGLADLFDWQRVSDDSVPLI